MAFSWFSVPQRGHLILSRVYSPSASFLLQLPHRIVSTLYACAIALHRRARGGGALAESRLSLLEVAGRVRQHPAWSHRLSFHHLLRYRSSTSSTASCAPGASVPVSSAGMNLRSGMVTFLPRPAWPPKF